MNENPPKDRRRIYIYIYRMTFEMPDESQIPPFVSQFLKHFVAMAEPWDFWERLEKVVKNQSDLAAQNKTMQKIYKKHRKKN